MAHAIAWRVSAVLAVALITAAALAPPSSALAPPRTRPGEAPPGAPSIIMESTGSKVTSFFFGKSGLITPIPPFNESHGQEADALGVSFPRVLVSNVGTWAVTLVDEGMVIDSLEGLSIWASSSQGAQNVRFIVQVEVNGNSAGTLRTVTKPTLGASPEEFTIDAGGSQMTRSDFPKGTQLSFNLQYSASSSPLPVGPSGSSTFHYYGDLYRSRVDFVTNPFNITLADVKMQADRVNVTEIVREAFGVDPAERVLTVSFNGPTNSVDRYVRLVNTVIDPQNGTTYVWNWFFERQGGVSSGQYTIALSGGYVGSDVNYTNVTVAEMKFPKPRDEGGGFMGGLLLPLVVVAGAAGGAAIAWRVTARRRRGLA